MNKVVIRIVASATGETTRDDGRFLLSYEPHSGPHGRFVTTSRINAAMVFDDAVKAIECWQQISTSNPTRPDGKPNRPLTAFTIEVQKVEP